MHKYNNDICNSEISGLYGYTVCEEHKVVVITKAYTEKEAGMVRDYVKKISELLLKNKEFLSHIQQKKLLNNDLSDEEKSIKEWCDEFNSIAPELLLLIDKKTEMDTEYKKLLYRLLCLSGKIPKELEE